MTTHEEIRIYVACLAAYNNGYLHGHWIDATQATQDIQQDIQAMLQVSPIDEAEEYAVHDYEGFGSIPISKYESLANIEAYATFIAEHGALGAALIAEFGNVDAATTAMDDYYVGQYQSVEEFCEELTQEQGDIPAHLEPYIDYERMARDMAISDVLVIEVDYHTHLFWQH